MTRSDENPYGDRNGSFSGDTERTDFHTMSGYEMCLREEAYSRPGQFGRKADENFCTLSEKWSEAVDSKVPNLTEAQRRDLKYIGKAFFSDKLENSMRATMMEYSRNPSDFRAVAEGLAAVLYETGVQVEYGTNKDNIVDGVLHFAEPSVGTLRLKYKSGDYSVNYEFDTNGRVGDREFYKGSAVYVKEGPRHVMTAIRNTYLAK